MGPIFGQNVALEGTTQLCSEKSCRGLGDWAFKGKDQGEFACWRKRAKEGETEGLAATLERGET